MDGCCVSGEQRCSAWNERMTCVCSGNHWKWAIGVLPVAREKLWCRSAVYSLSPCTTQSRNAAVASSTLPYKHICHTGGTSIGRFGLCTCAFQASLKHCHFVQSGMYCGKDGTLSHAVLFSSAISTLPPHVDETTYTICCQLNCSSYTFR